MIWKWLQSHICNSIKSHSNESLWNVELSICWINKRPVPSVKVNGCSVTKICLFLSSNEGPLFIRLASQMPKYSIRITSWKQAVFDSFHHQQHQPDLSMFSEPLHPPTTPACLKSQQPCHWLKATYVKCCKFTTVWSGKELGPEIFQMALGCRSSLLSSSSMRLH